MCINVCVFCRWLFQYLYFVFVVVVLSFVTFGILTSKTSTDYHFAFFEFEENENSCASRVFFELNLYIMYVMLWMLVMTS